VREYLAGLKWDGIPRLDRWLTTYLGVEDSTYAREVGLRVLLAGVARARNPGCKFDEMMILEGAQGAKKSSALAVLAGKAEWFTDTVPLGADERRFMESVAGKWIVEASELRGMKRGEVEALKATLSRQVDRARLAYARLPVDRPRQCILIGTTNAEEYLRDGSGNRRFWPVKVGEVKLDELVRDRDQLWAEAAHRQARGEAIHMDPAIWAAAQVEQASRQARDPFADALEAALGEVEDGRLTVRDAWLIVGMDPGKATQEDNVRLGEAMRALGWRRDKLRFSDGSPRRCYAVGSGSQRVSVEGGGQGVVVLVDGRRRLD
jgi:predicted P-loop ATPase